MARGDTQQSPWTWDTNDYLGRRISVSVPFNMTTRAILNGVVIHRDPGCLFSQILWDNPNDATKLKRSPVVPEGDTTLTANQLRQATGFQTIEDVLSVQITAE